MQKPAKDTIFSPSFGNRPTYLVGRDAVVQAFLDGLDDAPGSRSRSMILLGQRGSGKTVLLWEFADQARKKDFVVASPTVVSEGMLGRIVEKIQDDGERSLKKKRSHISGGSLGALGFSAGLQFTPEVQETKSFQYKLLQLAKRLTEKGKGLLILIDELQANSSEIRQIVVAYQELVGEGLNVALVMAGLPGAVSATLNDKVLTFLNRATKVTLEPLAFSDVDAYFQRAFNELGIHICPEDRMRAAKAAEGSPYLMQLIGHNLVLRAASGEVDKDILESAILAAQMDYENDVCKTTLASLSEQDVSFLKAMSIDEDASKVSDVAVRMEVTYDYSQKYRRRLIDAGVIMPAGRGLVEFAVPMLKDYLRKLEDL